VLALGAIAAVLVTVLPSLQKTFTIVTGIGAVTVPTASTIMAVDIFLMPRLTGIRRPLSSGNDVPSWQQTATGNWLAVVALLSGTLVGAVTGGLIPGTSGFGNTYIGFPPLQAWLTGAAVYLVGVVVLTRRSDPQRTSIVLGFPSLGPPEITPPPEPAVVEPAEAPLTTA
jgi:hypothetical protein